VPTEYSRLVLERFHIEKIPSESGLFHSHIFVFSMLGSGTLSP